MESFIGKFLKLGKLVVLGKDSSYSGNEKSPQIAESGGVL